MRRGQNWALHQFQEAAIGPKHLRTLIFKRYAAIKNGLISGFISHLKLGETQSFKAFKDLFISF